MAVSAFKSSSRRGSYAASSNTVSSTKDPQTEDLGKKFLNRRSRSVSAVSRNHVNTSSQPSVSDFSNKRDNPLFCSSNPSSPESGNPPEPVKGGGDVSDSRRGRSVSRSVGSVNQNSGTRKDLGRSLSRVDTGRRPRSVSRGHYRNSESEIEGEHVFDLSLRNKEIGKFALNGQKKANNTSSDTGLSTQTRNLQTWTSQHPLSQPSDRSTSCVQAGGRDVISTSSFPEGEEEIVKAVCEQMKSFQSDHPPGVASSGGIYETVRSEVQRAVSEIRNDLENVIRSNNPAITTTEDTIDIPLELVNLDAIELVSDIRREYATKLEQSQERARKLRADLAVEEQRGLELGRILKEILSDPKSSDTRKSRIKRKTSIERRKMSRRLTEEAMNYFDECVSISTFDSSDFSSLEDPLPSTVVETPPMGSSRFFLNEGSSFSASHLPSGYTDHHEESDNQTQCSLSFVGSDFTARSSYSGSKDANLMHANDRCANLVDSSTPRSGKFQFSSAPESMGSFGSQDIRHYIKKFEKDLRKEGVEWVNIKSSYNADDYDLIMSAESLLFDKVILRNRIDSGGLLVCNVRTF